MLRHQRWAIARLGCGDALSFAEPEARFDEGARQRCETRCVALFIAEKGRGTTFCGMTAPIQHREPRNGKRQRAVFWFLMGRNLGAIG
ncbi:MAG: hypothetical protein C4334_05180 [Pyrinomonas sp.]